MNFFWCLYCFALVACSLSWLSSTLSPFPMMIHLSCTFRRRWPSRLSVHKTSRMSFSLLKGHILSNSMTCFLFFSTKSYWVVWVLKPDQTHTANSKEKWNLKQKAPLCFGSGIDHLHIEVSLCEWLTWMAHIVRCFEVLVRLEISIYHLVWLASALSRMPMKGTRLCTHIVLFINAASLISKSSKPFLQFILLDWEVMF